MSTLKGDLLIAGQDLFTSSSVSETNLGVMATTGDGRYFRYVLVGGTTLVPGQLYQASAEVTGWENLACAAAVAGATTIVTTSTLTATLNQMAGGLLTVTASTGAGYTYKIKGNTAAAGAVCTITLEDPLLTNIALTTSTVDIIANPYSGVVLCNSTISSTPLGVAVYPIVNGQYGWLQVKGITSVLADGAIAVGTNVVASNGTSGSVEAGADATDLQAFVGTAVTGISTTEYGFINLRLV